MVKITNHRQFNFRDIAGIRIDLDDFGVADQTFPNRPVLVFEDIWVSHRRIFLKAHKTTLIGALDPVSRIFYANYPVIAKTSSAVVTLNFPVVIFEFITVVIHIATPRADDLLGEFMIYHLIPLIWPQSKRIRGDDRGRYPRRGMIDYLFLAVSSVPTRHGR